jgi:ribosome biogenesis protein Nip4
MSELEEFLAAIGVSYKTVGLKVNINDRRFVVAPEVAKHIHDKGRLVYAGGLLGRRKAEFVPSATLLWELGRMLGVHKVWVDERVGWLFTCGRDIFVENIVRSEGDLVEGACFLVMQGDSCLGYGRMDKSKSREIIKNLFDIGDFLRRER